MVHSYNDQTILRKSKLFEISQYSNNTYVLFNKKNDTRLSISEPTKILINLIDGETNLRELTIKLNQQLQSNLTTESLIEVITDKLMGYGILEDDDDIKTRGFTNFLNLKIKILSAPVVKVVTKPFISFFSVKAFYTILIITYVTIIYNTYQLDVRTVYKHLDASALIFSLALYYISILIHEIGHASACYKFNVPGGEIGFGFYFLFPAFYSDVSNAWRLPRNQRLIVDLGGVYLQGLFCAFLMIIFGITKNLIFIYPALLIVGNIIMNLNPFLRFDGYWIMSDLLNIPNLRSKSRISFRLLIRSLKNRSEVWKNNKMNRYLVAYYILRLLFIILVYLFLGSYYLTDIVYFIPNLFSFFKTMYLQFPDITFTLVKNQFAPLFIPMVFYLIVIRKTKSISSKIKRKIKNAPKSI